MKFIYFSRVKTARRSILEQGNNAVCYVDYVVFKWKQRTPTKFLRSYWKFKCLISLFDSGLEDAFVCAAYLGFC